MALRSVSFLFMVLKVKRSATFAKKEKSEGKGGEKQEKAQFEGYKSLASAHLAEKKKQCCTCAEAISHQWAHQVTVLSKKVFQL